jgi:hypothetical protein
MRKLQNMNVPCDSAMRRALLIPVRAAARAAVLKRMVNNRLDGLLPFDEWRVDGGTDVCN